MEVCKECGGLMREFPIGNCTTPHIASTEKPAREFWLNEWMNPTDIRFNCASARDKLKEFIDDYDALKAERDEFNQRMITALADAHQYSKERDALKRENNDLKILLEAAKNESVQERVIAELKADCEYLREMVRDVSRTLEKEAPEALAEKVKEVYSLKDELRHYKKEVELGQRQIGLLVKERNVLKAELEDTMAAASIHADEHRKARAKLEVAREALELFASAGPVSESKAALEKLGE